MVDLTAIWTAINTISNIILVSALVIVTLYYAKEVNKQTTFLKIDRLSKEMELLVSPLSARIEDKTIFKKSPEYNIDDPTPRNQVYIKFWDEVKRNEYLAPNYLRLAINNYLDNVSNSIHREEEDESYIIARDKLYKEIKKRYDEIQDKLSILNKKI